MLRENMSYTGGSNKISKLLHDTNCDVMKVTPMTVQNFEGQQVECNLEKLEGIFYRVIRPYQHDRMAILFGEGLTALNIKLSRERVTYKTERIRNYYGIIDTLYDLRISGSIAEQQFDEFYQWVQPFFSSEIYAVTGKKILDAIGHQWRTEKGRLSRRLSSYLYEKFQIKLSAQELTDFGIAYDAIRLTKENFYVRVTNNFDWDDRYYGHGGGSCWWGDYTNARNSLYNNGGYALLFYPDSEHTYDSDGIARLWVAPVNDEQLVVFNYYGRGHIRDAAAVMTKLLEDITGDAYTYGKRSIDTPDFMYINSDMGYAIWKKGSPVPDNTVYLEWEEYDYPFESRDDTYCTDCGERYDDDDLTEIDGEYYCDGCRDDRYFYCDNCDCYCSRDEMNEFPDREGWFYCDYCVERLTEFVCNSCGQAFYDSSHGVEADDTGNTYCNYGRYHCCAEDKITECEHGVFENTCEECQEEQEEE